MVFSRLAEHRTRSAKIDAMAQSALHEDDSGSEQDPDSSVDIGTDSVPDTDDSGQPPSPVHFKQLVGEHIDFVWRSLRRFGVPAADVDDATQQVFLIANQKLDKIRAGSERAFLVGVATRVASHARRALHRREAAEQNLSSNPRPTNPDPEELTERLEARELLDSVLDTMPLELRSVFVLFELEELSVDQIARALVLPRGTVATRLRRAREVFHNAAQEVGARVAPRGSAP
jgi:RNA polymerase sigma-70 factor (ECF subfamily)